MQHFAKLFKVTEQPAQVLVYNFFDEMVGIWRTCILTTIDGDLYSTYIEQEDLIDAYEFLTKYNQKAADDFYNNTIEFGEVAPPIVDYDYLLDYDYDEYMDWLDEQHPHNLKVLLKFFKKTPEKFARLIEILEIYIKSNENDYTSTKSDNSAASE